MPRVSGYLLASAEQGGVEAPLIHRPMQAYDTIAAWYSATRSPEVGVAEVRAFLRGLPDGASMLDLGCGDGVPLTRALVAGGARVTALDSSAAMVARFRAALPGVPVHHARIQDAAFPAASFDGVLAWGVLFHLTAAEQRAAIRSVAGWLRPGGRFLFTSGDEAGTRRGEMAGVAFEYVSLGAAGYRAEVERAGMRLESHRRDAWDNHVYVAANDADGESGPFGVGRNAR